MKQIETWLVFAQDFLTNLVAQDGKLLFLAFVISCAAVYISRYLARIIIRKNPKRIRHYVRNYVASLLPALFASIALYMIAHYATDHASHADVFHFFFKLSFAWLIANFVYSISSKQEAGWIVYTIILPLAVAYILGVADNVAILLNDASFSFGKQKITALMVVKTISAIIVLFWLASRLMNIVNARMSRIKSLHISHRTLATKIIQILLYFLVFVIAMQIIGIDLTALSVFGGALGVGLGFGLQKIASNFISGIILLMERSIQVGDMVELPDGIVGFIRKTGARYTLLETIDSREVLIPNEEFIIQRTITWTHSNNNGRIVIMVGVSYNSDLELVQKLMLEAATEHPRTLADPAPMCVMEAFADSSVSFGLYFYIPQVNEGRLQTKSEVLFSIWNKFKVSGIEIPYPQRVVHHTHSGSLSKEMIDNA